MNKERMRREDIDFISRLNGYGSLTSAQTNNLRGINVNHTGTPAPVNQDSYGYTFFTRPILNLSYDNLAATRLLTPLLSSDQKSMARAIRCMLDPLGERNHSNIIRSDIFDYKQAFLPVLTNNLVSISGWPDMTVDAYTSKPGVYNEAYSMVDGTSLNYETYDVTASFRNIQGDPITLLFSVWVHYSAMVYNGTMVPYPQMILENEIDYMTRIYRIVTDSEHRYVQKIAACGAAFPQASPLGNAFNYTHESPNNRENDEISIPFRCIGVNFLDPILVDEFNRTVELLNPDMGSSLRGGMMKKLGATDYFPEAGGQKVGKTLLKLLGHRCYPRIDTQTYELQWWVSLDDFKWGIAKLKEKGAI